MKLTGIRALALTGTICAGAGLSGCHSDVNKAYLISQPKVTAGLLDSATNYKGRFNFRPGFCVDEEALQYAADSVKFSLRADSAKADTAKKAFAMGVDAGKKFILDSIAKAAKAR